MARYRITVRNTDIELRGYVDVVGVENLNGLASALRDIGVVVASPAADDYNPFVRWDADFREVAPTQFTADELAADYIRSWPKFGGEYVKPPRPPSDCPKARAVYDEWIADDAKRQTEWEERNR